MKKRTVIALCLLSATLGAGSTAAFFLWRDSLSSKQTAVHQQDRFQLFPGIPAPSGSPQGSSPQFPDPDDWESHFFQQFFGNQPSFFVSSPKIQMREDETHFYFDFPLKENEESKLKANVVDGNLEIEGEIQERQTEDGGKSERFLQRTFSQMLSLPPAADPKSLMIISEPGKTVIRFQKRTED